MKVYPACTEKQINSGIFYLIEKLIDKSDLSDKNPTMKTRMIKRVRKYFSILNKTRIFSIKLLTIGWQYEYNSVL